MSKLFLVRTNEYNVNNECNSEMVDTIEADDERSAALDTIILNSRAPLTWTFDNAFDEANGIELSNISVIELTQNDYDLLRIFGI